MAVQEDLRHFSRSTNGALHLSNRLFPEKPPPLASCTVWALTNLAGYFLLIVEFLLHREGSGRPVQTNGKRPWSLCNFNKFLFLDRDEQNFMESRMELWLANFLRKGQI